VSCLSCYQVLIIVKKIAEVGIFGCYRVHAKSLSRYELSAEV